MSVAKSPSYSFFRYIFQGLLLVYSHVPSPTTWFSLFYNVSFSKELLFLFLFFFCTFIIVSLSCSCFLVYILSLFVRPLTHSLVKISSPFFPLFNELQAICSVQEPKAHNHIYYTVMAIGG